MLILHNRVYNSESQSLLISFKDERHKKLNTSKEIVSLPILEFKV
jgi:hypothetical protein